LLSYEDSCPLFNTQYYNEGLTSQALLSAYQFYQPFVTEINARLNGTNMSQITNADNLTDFGDTLICDYYAGKPIPLGYDPTAANWTNLTFSFGYFVSQIYYGTPKNVQIYSVPLYQNLIGYLESTVNGSSNLQFLFLSAHDTTLMLILSSLNLTTPICLWNNFVNNGTMNDPTCHYPIFASNIKMELWNSTEGFFVKFFYDDVLLNVTGCGGTECAYETFIDVLTAAQGGYSMNDYNSFCGVTAPVTDNSINTADIVIISVLGGLSLIMLVALVLLCLTMRKQQKQDDGFSLVKNAQ